MKTAEQVLKEIIDFSKPIDQSVLEIMIPVAMKEYAKQVQEQQVINCANNVGILEKGQVRSAERVIK